MKLEHKLEHLTNSTRRLNTAYVCLPDHDYIFWDFMRREAWVHIKRSVEFMWMVLRKKE